MIVGRGDIATRRGGDGSKHVLQRVGEGHRDLFSVHRKNSGRRGLPDGEARDSETRDVIARGIERPANVVHPFETGGGRELADCNRIGAGRRIGRGSRCPSRAGGGESGGAFSK